jgi:hypothetical protein
VTARGGTALNNVSKELMIPITVEYVKTLAAFAQFDPTRKAGCGLSFRPRILISSHGL